MRVRSKWSGPPLKNHQSSNTSLILWLRAPGKHVTVTHYQNEHFATFTDVFREFLKKVTTELAPKVYIQVRPHPRPHRPHGLPSR
jgi:hypothetical protein